jgi:hypothetical protein
VVRTVLKQSCSISRISRRNSIAVVQHTCGSCLSVCQQGKAVTTRQLLASITCVASGSCPIRHICGFLAVREAAARTLTGPLGLAVAGCL